jgi:hypothetical protein
LTGIPASLRFLLSDVLGVDDSAPPAVPDDLPAALRPVVGEAIARLIVYQGPSYAQLYLRRLRRFVRRREVDSVLLGDIARLMAQRMCYDDPIRIAQCRLAAAAGGDATSDETRRFQLNELVTALPAKFAWPLMFCLERAGWLQAPVSIRFSAASRWGVRRLRLEAGLRRWRPFSVRYGVERLWVERWLHMIDRALVRQPAAVAAIVETATMIQGSGESYRRGLADWHGIIDGLVKPALDGNLPIADLAAAVAEARAASQPGAPESVADVVSRIRARTTIGK